MGAILDKQSNKVGMPIVELEKMSKQNWLSQLVNLPMRDKTRVRRKHVTRPLTCCQLHTTRNHRQTRHIFPSHIIIGFIEKIYSVLSHKKPKWQNVIRYNEISKIYI